jgi:dihydroflavonol-4-reductase
MILVTGASGFLGRHVVQQLSARGLAVRALYHNHVPSADLTGLPGVAWLKCDLLDVFDVEQAMNGIAEVYHCAAIVSFDTRKRASMIHSNPESTANVVNQCLEQGVRRLIYASSVAALGRTGDAEKEITEEEEWGESRYNSAYGISKYLAEMEVWRGIGEGLNAAIVNPGIILGPGHSLTSKLMAMAWRQFPFYSGGISSWVGVNDVAKAMIILMESDLEAERFIISAGNFSYREIFNMMAASLNKRAPFISTPVWLANIIARLMMARSAITGKEALITDETVSNATSISIYNNNKFLQAFPGFNYMPIKQSIDDMALVFTEGHKK